MRVNFFEQGEFEQPPALMGTVTLDELGKVVIPDTLAAFLSETKVGAPGGRQVTPADGERYLEGLVLSFRGTRFWAEPAGVRRGDRLKGKAPDSDPLDDGPEILILDPNDPKGAYEQLMEQFTKPQGQGRVGRLAGVKMSDTPVIDLDDSFENQNWLRLVAAARPGKTREAREQAMEDGEAPNHTPRSIFLHDTAKEDTEDRAGSLDG
jgi:hypothetical protein